MGMLQIIVSRLIYCLLPFCLFAQVSGQSSVWEVSKGESIVYLGGTCHVLRAADFPLPPEFYQAYAAADTLVFEIAPAEIKDPGFALSLMARSRYTDGRTLKTVLSDEAYTALAQEGQALGLPIEVLDGFKPGMAVMMLSFQALTRIGVTQEGVDLHFSKLAEKDGKTIQALETAEFQIDLISTLGDGREDELVLYSLQDLAHIETFFDALIQAWRSGDVDALEKGFVTEMKAGFPEIHAAMLADRNADWVPQIQAMLKTPETEFVLVGVGHMPGSDGLLALLQNEGYHIRQIQADAE
ncbi:MAG: TraB/GumN family protein [Puniceicoccaceae bacterium]|nr:MAG: TraB/GumN family protein [Puniceicoccaceae bacterium]